MNTNTKKKRGRNKVQVPQNQKGNDDLTPTQLRNRRKRRAKKQQRKLREGSKAPPNSGGAAGGKNRGDCDEDSDPSARYISDPASAPAVRAARRYIAPILKTSPAAIASSGQFRVHLGPIRGWRTASKLAVRPDVGGKVAVGLFLPRSHKILPVPDCIAHHPSINRAVECIVRACHEVGVAPYRERGNHSRKAKLSGVDAETSTCVTSERLPIDGSQDGGVHETSDSKGTGQLRYVSINVARETGAVQITLVWNGRPPSHVDVENGEIQSGETKKREHHATIIEDNALKKLVRRLVSMSAKENNERKINSISVGDRKHSETAENGRPRKRRRRSGRRHDNCEANASRDDINDRIQAETRKGNDNDADVGEAKTNENRGREGLEINRVKLLGCPYFTLHSLWINYNPSSKHSNAIFSHEPSCWQHVHGPHAIVEYLAFSSNCPEQLHTTDKNIGRGRIPADLIPLNFPPNVFRQANLDAFADIVWRIRDRIARMKNDDDDGSGIACVELYGGVGTIGLNLSDIVTSLVSSDENPNNLRCFHESACALLPHVRSSLEYMNKSAANMINSERALLARARALIVDPPRKGLDVEVVDYLCSDEAHHSKLELVAYVSCGFYAFQRDCNALLNSGRWEVEFAEGHLLFPGSDAIETLAFFVPRLERQGSG